MYAKALVEDAFVVLREVGVEGLCLPDSSAYAPLLPRCSGEGAKAPIFEIRGDSRILVFDDIDSDGGEHGGALVVNIIGAVVCVLLVALVSCMFLGFITLDVLDLRIKARASVDEAERTYAARLIPVVEQHHRLLVTLLLLNTIAYECLPLFLDRLVPSWAAILLSVTFLLIFGEIIPSAIFTGPAQLRLAGYLVPLVSFSMCMLYPLAMPLTRLLDCLVPHDENSDDTYHRGELSALVRIQHEERQAKAIRGTGKKLVLHPVRASKSDAMSWRALKKEIMETAANVADHEDVPPVDQSIPPLHTAEVKMVEGALAMKTKVALDIYTPLRKMFTVPSDLVLSKDNITLIYSEGYSRIPVYDPDPERGDRQCAMCGILMARQLILVDWDDERDVSSVPLQIPPCVSPRTNLIDLLHILQREKSLMVFVCARPDVAKRALGGGKAIPVEAGFMGLITLEDVLESLLQDRIYDEEDVQERNLASARLTQWAASVLQRFTKRKSKKRRASRGIAPDGQSASLLSSQNQTMNVEGEQPSSPSSQTAPLLVSTALRGETYSATS